MPWPDSASCTPRAVPYLAVRARVVFPTTMDPITGIGFAASVVQLLHFSIKLAQTAHEIKKRGSSSDIADAAALSENVSAISVSVQKSLRDPQVNARGLTEEEKQPLRIGQKCEEVAGKLRKEVDKLTTKGSGSRLDSLKIVSKTVWKAGKIQKMMEELDGFRKVLETGLLTRLR